MLNRIATVAIGSLLLVMLGRPVAAADRALLIGIDSYGTQSISAKIDGAARNDVSAMTGLLVSKFGFAKSGIKVLLNEGATKDKILAGISDWLAAGTKAGDRVVFYFSGLGYFEADTGGDEKDGLDEAIVPYDAAVTSSGDAKGLSGLLSDDEFSFALKILEGRHVIIVLDAGFSGAVTRAGDVSVFAAKVPQLAAATRAIAVEPKAKAQKKEGGFVETAFGKGTLSVWSAVSSSQLALIDAKADGGPKGVFTKLLVEGLGQAKADKNGNGSISNAELLTYVATKSKAYCAGLGDACEMGLTPRLDPGTAHGLVAYSDTGGAKKAVAGKKTAGTGKLTIDVVTDLLAKGNVDKVVVKQIPPSPVHVGVKNIRFQVISPHGGHLILLNLTDDGKLIQLYPNQFSSKHETERTGLLSAGSPLTVPDVYYGMRFNATAPSKGYIVALVTRDRIDFGSKIKTRAIEVIPRQEATETLTKIAEKIGTPVKADKVEENTDFAHASVATMRYEILPK